MKKFEEVSIKTQKKRIVQDAITQIQSGVLTAEKGEYMLLRNFDEYGNMRFKNLKSLQKILQLNEQNTCEVCAKGALFAACVLNVNKVSTSNNYTEEEFQKRKLVKWFSELELDMIEAAFEKCIIRDSTNKLRDKFEYTLLGETCMNFGKRYGPNEERLLAILNNILENGKFKP